MTTARCRLPVAPACRRAPLDLVLRRWLTAPGSLTARLQAAFAPVQVQLLAQGGAPLRREEQRDLCQRGRGPQHGHRREVLLQADGVALVWARSTLAGLHARTGWKAVRGLGDRPLAELLFADRRVRRSALQPLWLAPADPLNRRIRRQWRQALGAEPPWRGLWARSSVFWRAGQPLRVMEAFSPLVWQRRTG